MSELKAGRYNFSANDIGPLILSKYAGNLIAGTRLIINRVCIQQTRNGEYEGTLELTKTSDPVSIERRDGMLFSPFPEVTKERFLGLFEMLTSIEKGKCKTCGRDTIGTDYVYCGLSCWPIER